VPLARALSAGGIGMLQALAGRFPDVLFCPTGGITRAMAPDYLALPNVVCAGGSWVAPRAMLAAGDWAGIEALARDAAALRKA
jgi:2-dehydro-3-deoxyphosphogluconate aldolase / (4S)-4-hydroxy-2-oxoglutarate aldolase